MDSYKIVRLSERVSIDVWKEIADLVQLLDIYSFDNEEFARNLIFLREKLMERGKIINFGRTNPRCCLEIGLLNLLKAIYSANVYDDYKKANFYEKIYQLDELGIPSIIFNPIDFPDSVSNISFLKKMNDEIGGIYNCFTDGEFKIDYTDIPLNRWYDLFDIKDANYIINVLIEKEFDRGIINRDESYVILKNFDGIFPNKETLYKLEFPKTFSYSEHLDNGRKQHYLKQAFYPFDREDGNYPKKLVRMKNNYHYE